MDKDLLFQLHTYGNNGNVLGWIENYLLDRQQATIHMPEVE